MYKKLSLSHYTNQKCTVDLMKAQQYAREKMQDAVLKINDIKYMIAEIEAKKLNILSNPNVSWNSKQELYLMCQADIKTANEEIHKAQQEKEQALHEIRKIGDMLSNPNVSWNSKQELYLMCQADMKTANEEIHKAQQEKEQALQEIRNIGYILAN